MKRIIPALTMTVMTVFSTPLLAEGISASPTQSATDDAIAGKVEAALLFSGQFDTMDIRTDVSKGQVILTGKVNSEVNRELAQEVAASLDGVVSVENKLDVVKPALLEGDLVTLLNGVRDAQMVSLIRTQLLLESGLSGDDIDVHALRGIVTLTGKVESLTERDLIIAIAKNTDDVVDVKSELSVDS